MISGGNHDDESRSKLEREATGVCSLSGNVYGCEEDEWNW
jgi:hypothetical protein